MTQQQNCTKILINCSAYEKFFEDHEDILEEAESLGLSANEFKGWLMNSEEPPEDITSGTIGEFMDWKESLKTVEIDENNFDQYFFNIREHKPKPGQILACHEAMADLVDGNLKRDLIHILMHTEKGGDAGPQLLCRLAGATEASAFKVVKEMVSDLLSGMGSDEVAEKPYEFHCQHFYYTQIECLPDDDPHWWSTSLIDVTHPSKKEIDRVVGQLAEDEQN